MNKKQRTAINPTRSENFPDWYQEVVKEATLAENSNVRGCMIILPHGMGLWENIKARLDKEIKKRGVQNVYFPLLIPLASMQKEAEHVEGFAKECAVVTHRRLAQNEKGELKPEGELTEPYIIRPTSEMVIGEAFARWIKSHRDLPYCVNQWANVMRWEMRPRLFLRTAEFLWQEGHTAHASKEDAVNMTVDMIRVYEKLLADYLAIPVIVGQKSESERFPGAVDTYTVEAMMQDGKSLQAGTSHYLGQNFAKAQKITFLGADEKEAFCHTTSWGVSTRMIGGLVMAHGDDDGLVVPPKATPYHVSIIPMIRKEEQRDEIISFCHKLQERLEALTYDGASLRVELDDSHKKPVDKYWTRIKQGIPFVAEVGPRDVENNAVFLTNRLARNEKAGVSVDDFVASVVSELEKMQTTLYETAKKRMEENTVVISSKEEFLKLFSEEREVSPFALCHIHDCEETINFLKEHKTTIRCYPQAEVDKGTKGKCIISGKDNCLRAIVAKSY